MIQITEDKAEHLVENFEKGFRYLGKAMQCIDELKQKGSFGERDDWDDDDDEFGMRGGYGYGQRSYGMRDAYGMRRGVRGTGPYSRYR